ncbi:MAG TPA: nitric oxide reductase large subunit [Bdellovibrionales bacterium]|nr:MAG: nitric oxide reductase large subunit [Bdellovibrionales bacterium GWB1_52_6]OFZ04977.1 MAG: nitric oxide reductase large subunit [Bdellovibrionales bacterium GWA1_52_35]OFZ42566.1 MAG: nitric oxide reductase large subunit [Bdellovibrionales bacterium GWC1_52_8]HAR41182.1 nitric oxide reductase large subunit [Bdellovibrionales bacterium]HCM41207.1 nitric oxide reductase large subunit [Bdellovibrionales bacterium]
MISNRKHWLTLLSVLIIAFSILGFLGREVYRQAPPIPQKIMTPSGEVVITHDEIMEGQIIWQSIGGQQVGSVWGHGAYQAPDWTADWLHRELENSADLVAAEKFQAKFVDLSEDKKAVVKSELKHAYRTNTYDEKSGTATLSGFRVEAVRKNLGYYSALFSNTAEYKHLRESYAIQDDILIQPDRRELMGKFFFWTAWAAATNRPGTEVTYTNNWPHEKLIDNTPSSANVMWSIASVILLLVCTGLLVWYLSFKRKEEELTQAELPVRDPLEAIQLTPSMKAVAKYCGVVILLFGIQVLLGAVTAHYTVEGQNFYGFPLSQYLPYSLSRVWHIQTALFWIATSFLAAGLFLAPIVNGGRDPKFQRLGVNVLFGALLLVVGGSLTGEALAIHQKLSLGSSFWFGIQGYEYTDLGRIWQIALSVGLVLWMILMLRCLIPAFKKSSSDAKQLLVLFAGASAAIGLFYFAGLFYSAKSHLSVMEYWRWWVVHLWVEGFFEVFATVSMAFIFSKLGLIKESSATRASLFSASIFLLAGIPGTFHHLYFSGTPIAITAVGACFSALEVVPLLLIGMEAMETSKMALKTEWMKQYYWPIRFFVAVAFWNFLGAGVFGFMINPPIALYYMQGLNTTAVHAHAATFGVYGMLSLGLVLFVSRRLKAGIWKEAPLKVAFWSMNIGLGLMIGLSLLPIGLIQAYSSMEHGFWYARGTELMQTPLIQNLRWLRIVGDSIFLFGVGSLTWFMVGLPLGYSLQRAPSLKEGNLELA